MIITAGCGISQSGWQKWPTWPKYVDMVTDHINVGAPAAGNHFIGLAAMRKISQTNASHAIVTWTSYEKLDLYVDSFEIANEISNYPTRNFLINMDGETVNSKGWWPSSVSNDNHIKTSYARWQSDTLHAYITLQSIYSLQIFCKSRNVKLKQYLSYALPLDRWSQDPELSWLFNLIDWTALDSKVLADDYYHSRFREYQLIKSYGLIPTAPWHINFFVDDILPWLADNDLVRKNVNWNKLMKAAEQLAEKIKNEDINTSEQEQSSD